MPTRHCPYVNLSAVWRRAEKEVKAKFPGIIVGSSGWHRAVNNRVRRLA